MAVFMTHGLARLADLQPSVCPLAHGCARRSYRFLLVVPVNVVLNWYNELGHWLPHLNSGSGSERPLGLNLRFVVHGKADRKDKIKKWAAQPGSVLIIGVKQFANCVLWRGKGTKGKEMPEEDQEVSGGCTRHNMPIEVSRTCIPTCRAYDVGCPQHDDSMPFMS